jgi:hypothetical protein
MTLTADIMDRRTPEEIRDMARTYAMYLDGSLSRADGRPLAHRYYQAWQLVQSGQV